MLKCGVQYAEVVHYEQESRCKVVWCLEGGLAWLFVVSSYPVELSVLALMCVCGVAIV